MSGFCHSFLRLAWVHVDTIQFVGYYFGSCCIDLILYRRVRGWGLGVRPKASLRLLNPTHHSARVVGVTKFSLHLCSVVEYLTMRGHDPSCHVVWIVLLFKTNARATTQITFGHHNDVFTHTCVHTKRSIDTN